MSAEYKLILDEDERDCLQELMNISYGSATAAIAQIIDKFATLNIPKIEIATISEFKEYLKNKFDHDLPYYVCNQGMNGTLSGENMFIMDEKSTYNLAKEFDLDDSEIDDEELKDVVLEISNIISSTTLSKLASLLEAEVIFSPPSVKIVNSINDFRNNFENEYKYIIIISTEIKFEDQNIQGELLILSKDDSIGYIKNALNKMIEEF